jgi:hypothetical protein
VHKKIKGLNLSAFNIKLTNVKKKILIFLAFLALLTFAGYRFLYKEHRDISSEDADFTLTVQDLHQQFSTDTSANSKYADKTIVVEGKITSVDAEGNSITIDEKLSAVMKDKISPETAVAKTIRIKGRFVGYDDLLEELKMDQSTIIE